MVGAATLPASALFATELCLCSQPNYWIWAIVQGLPAIAVGYGLAFWAMAGLRARNLASIQVTLWLLCMVDLWFLPQKRTVSLLLGFLHGPIYDELILIDSGIVLQRLAHGLIGLALILLWLPQRSSRRQAFPDWIVCLCLAFLCMGSSRYSLSASFGHRSLTTKLGNVHELNDSASLIYATEIAKTPKSLDNFQEELRFHLDELKPLFPAAEKTRVYLYSSDQQKKLLFGGGATDVTDVVGPSIHVTLEPSPHSTLRHELVHALAAKTAFWGLGFHPNMAFTEGLAVALAPSDRSISLDQGVLSLLETKRLPDIQSLFSPLFWRVSGSRAYSVAGSLINYLLRHYGSEPVLALYQGHDWQELFPESQTQTIANWLKELRSQPSKQNLAAESLYRYPGILADICPHTKALYKARNLDELNAQRRHPKLVDRSTYRMWLQQSSPDNPRLRLEELRERARQILHSSQALMSLKSEIKQSLSWPAKTIEDVELKLLLLDLQSLDKSAQVNVDELTTLVEELKEIEVSEPLLRAIGARVLIERNEAPDERKAWRLYLAGFANIPPPTEKSGNFSIRTYLYWLNHPQTAPKVQNPATVSSYFFARLPPPIARPMTYNWYRRAAQYSDSIGKTKEALQLYQHARAFARDGQMALAEQNIRRLQKRLAILPKN